MPPLGSEFVTEAPSVRMSAWTPRLPLETKFVPVQVDVALVIHLGHARRQIDQFNYVAIDQRQVVDEPAIDDLSGLRIVGLDGLRSAVTSTV